MKLETYILRMLGLAFLFAAGSMLFVALPGIAVGAVHRLPGVSTVAVLTFLPMAVAAFVPYVLPVAFLLAVVATYGRLAVENEWTAIQMAGRNPYRMLGPAVALAFVLSTGIYFLNSRALPWLLHYQRSFQVSVLQDSIRNLSPGQTEVQFGDFYLASNYREENTFHDVFLEVPDPEREGGARSLVAKSARFEFTDELMTIHLGNVEFMREGGQGRIEYSRTDIPLATLIPPPKETYTKARYKGSRVIAGELASGGIDARTRRRYTYALHQRAANAVTCMLFVLLGVPTGILLRRGTQLGAMAVAVGYAILYWVSSLRLGKELAESGALVPALCAWGPLAVWCVLAGLMVHRTFRR
ncbi:MAG: LptF/LptG family permease [Planctomycetota bacterium]|jgi:lipopolysaccharide export system permease protein|nr:LptF/LptG family permease [Planctomycetota bacterium]MDP6761997.1 LptF/LptG family permease [Planctomycetota bacterium]MDP6989787.1 LptF/LptG family permease [Planctomycetota bacterium]